MDENFDSATSGEEYSVSTGSESSFLKEWFRRNKVATVVLAPTVLLLILCFFFEKYLPSWGQIFLSFVRANSFYSMGILMGVVFLSLLVAYANYVGLPKERARIAGYAYAILALVFFALSGTSRHLEQNERLGIQLRYKKDSAQLASFYETLNKHVRDSMTVEMSKLSLEKERKPKIEFVSTVDTANMLKLVNINAQLKHTNDSLLAVFTNHATTVPEAKKLEASKGTPSPQKPKGHEQKLCKTKKSVPIPRAWVEEQQKNLWGQ